MRFVSFNIPILCVYVKRVDNFYEFLYYYTRVLQAFFANLAGKMILTGQKKSLSENKTGTKLITKLKCQRTSMEFLNP